MSVNQTCGRKDVYIQLKQRESVVMGNIVRLHKGFIDTNTGNEFHTHFLRQSRRLY